MENLEKAVIGSLLQDNYALGLHWIYDTSKVESLFNEYDSAFDVQKDSFHKTKQKGDLTHYGDLTVWFMNYLKLHDEPDISTFYEAFVEWMDKYNGYKDHAMKTVYQNIKDGNYSGSSSSELGGLCKIGPILKKYEQQPNLAKLYAIAFTKATHDHPLPVSLASYFTDVVYAVSGGMSVEEALHQYIDVMPMEIANLFILAKESLDLEPVAAIKKLGQACPAEMAFPSVIYLLLKYKNDLVAMQQANVLAGGDSAARGMLLGLIVGASGIIIESALDTLNAKDDILSLIDVL
jgi:ADP-ribosylglycohydrolase